MLFISNLNKNWQKATIIILIFNTLKTLQALGKQSSKEGLINEDQWTEIAYEENWEDVVVIYNEDQTEEIFTIDG